MKEQNLSTTIAANDVSGVKRALDLGAKPNLCDNNGASPLCLAAKAGAAVGGVIDGVLGAVTGKEKTTAKVATGTSENLGSHLNI